MVAETTRGVKFIFSTAVDPEAAKAFEAMEKRVADLQKAMNFTMRLEGRTGTGPNGRNGNGSPQGGGAAARQSDRAARERERDAQRAFQTEAKWSRMAEAAVSQREASERAGRKRLSDMRREADERDRVSAERSAEKQRAFERDILDQQIKDLKRAAKERQQVLAEAAREDAHGWKRMSAIGRESFTTGRKTAAGFEALSAMGRAAMPRDRFAEGLQKLEADRAARTGWAGLGTSGADTQQRLNDLRAIERKDHEERKRALDAQKGQLREINSALYDVAHAFGQVTRAAGQFSLIGQRDMMKVLDTIFAIEGGINAIQGGMNAFRAISSIRKARAGMAAGGGAAKYAAGLARMGGAAGAGGIGAGGVGAVAGGGAGGIGLGLAGAGVTALAAGGIGLLGTFADRNRGVPGQVGGFWDTIGKGINSPVGSIQGGFLSLGSAIERGLNEPYGLTDKESAYRSQRLQEEEFERSYGANGAEDSRYAAIKRAKLHERRTELLEKYTNREMDRREAMRRRHEEIDSTVGRLESQRRATGFALAERRHEIRTGILQRRSALHGQLLGEAFGRHQTAYGEQLGLRQRAALGEYVSPSQARRVAAEEAREEGLVTGFDARRLEGLRHQRMANIQRGKQIGQDVHAARAQVERMQGVAGSETGREDAARELDAANERLKQNAQERARLEEEIRRVGIEGAQRQLQLREQGLATAKQTADALRGARQSAKERFGQLLPEQQRSLIESAEAMRGGHENRLQAERLRQFPELFAPELRSRDERMAEAGGFEQFAAASSLPGRLKGAEVAEQRELKLTVDQRQHITGELQFDVSQAAKNILDLFVPLLQRSHDDLLQQIDKKIEDANHDMNRRQNEQGRAMFGG